MNCSICLDEEKYTNISTLCKHEFHKICLDTWLNENETCPYCRNSLTNYIRDEIEVDQHYQRHEYVDNSSSDFDEYSYEERHESVVPQTDNYITELINERNRLQEIIENVEEYEYEIYGSELYLIDELINEYFTNRRY